ncbi:uncharacterized protein LOC116668469 [Camelus ferus]|uniref:Uncharacterized protein LOC116668469 n=1 Tax=Camelus ferus TaxID=419612 RepID=A0A8B8UBC7_CAMFR|nr:uncharacterized protein LOC116668469 [Camelus ferus]
MQLLPAPSFLLLSNGGPPLGTLPWFPSRYHLKGPGPPPPERDRAVLGRRQKGEPGTVPHICGGTGVEVTMGKQGLQVPLPWWSVETPKGEGDALTRKLPERPAGSRDGPQRGRGCEERPGWDPAEAGVVTCSILRMICCLLLPQPYVNITGKLRLEIFFKRLYLAHLSIKPLPHFLKDQVPNLPGESWEDFTEELLCELCLEESPVDPR